MTSLSVGKSDSVLNSFSFEMGRLVPCIFTILFIVVLKESITDAETDTLEAAWEYQCEISENTTDVIWILKFDNNTESLSRCYIGSQTCDQRSYDCAVAIINSTNSLLNISADFVKKKAGRVGYAEIINNERGEIRFDATNRSISWACVPLPETSTPITETPTTSEASTSSTESTTTTWETSITIGETYTTSGEEHITSSEPSITSNELTTDTSEAVITSGESTISNRETFTEDNYLSTITNEESTSTSESITTTRETPANITESFPIVNITTEPSTRKVSTTSNKSVTTSDQSTQSIHQQDSDGGVPAGAIAGIVVGIIALCFIVAMVFVMYKRRQKANTSFPTIDHNSPDEAVVVDCVNPVYKTSETSPDTSLPTAEDTQKSSCEVSQPDVIEKCSSNEVDHYATTSTTP